MRNAKVAAEFLVRKSRHASRITCAPLHYLLALLLCLVPLPGQAENLSPSGAQRTVILLHGLGRTYRSMNDMAAALAAEGYKVENIDYPSTDESFEQLLEIVSGKIERCCRRGESKLNFVTHSLGGILLRAYANENGAEHVGRAVMLSPPSRGSELVDELKDITVFQWITGPAGQQLGTDSESVPLNLGRVNFELGVITGDASFNPLYSWLIPGPDDGKVSVDRARVSGMADFIVLPHSHSFIMNGKEVIRQTLFFLANGRFDH
jgi:pimeloyl-ACP methyl ester carboxylesterase